MIVAGFRRLKVGESKAQTIVEVELFYACPVQLSNYQLHFVESLIYANEVIATFWIDGCRNERG